MTPPVCSVETCDKATHARGWCNAHYFRWKTTGDLQARKPLRRSPMVDRVCSVDHCEGRAKSRGLCEPHIRRSDGKVAQDQPIRPRYSSRFCSVEGCDRPISSLSFCSGHYGRLRNSGDVRPDVSLRALAPQIGECGAEGCIKPRYARGRCRTHYNQAYRVQRPDVYLAAYDRRWDRTRSKAFGVEWQSFSRLQVLVRDEWVCKLCLDPIDATLKAPNPHSASVDHIVPLSRGGAHVESNCQAAHLGCNMRKGSSIVEPSSEGSTG